MKHLVIIPDRVTSKRLSAVEMARRLSDAGYRITFIGKGGDYSQIDKFDYFRFDPEQTSTTTDSESSANEPVHPLHLLLEELSPDLLVIDIEMHEFVLAALASKFPVILFSVFFNMRKHKSMPPLHYDIVPGRGVTGFAFTIELAWLRFRLSKFISNQREKFKRRGKDKISKLENYAEMLGLRLADHVVFYQWLIPFLYCDLPVLVLNPIEMEFPFHPHYLISYVGPMICSDRANLPFIPKTVESGHDIENLLDSYRQRREEQRLIYCSFGCFFGGNDLKFWQKLVEALGSTGWDVIFALGNRLKAEVLGNIPSNIHCLQFAPQMDILSVADCAVIHAGMTTVYECILWEVPMVVYPFRVNDQMGTAARVVYHRLGLRGSREKDSPADIRNHIERAINDQAIKEDIGRMRNQIETYRKKNVVADAVKRIFEAAR
ncbi:MAG: hypothetical protein KJO60_10320 [Desulfofustis sp.]|nr:hypothetical protein [Desulfofustis sp.]